jgi:hypothetical protein
MAAGAAAAVRQAVCIHAVLSVADARLAHELMAANANTGKLILEVGPTLK